MAVLCLWKACCKCKFSLEKLSLESLMIRNFEVVKYSLLSVNVKICTWLKLWQLNLGATGDTNRSSRQQNKITYVDKAANEILCSLVAQFIGGGGHKQLSFWRSRINWRRRQSMPQLVARGTDQKRERESERETVSSVEEEVEEVVEVVGRGRGILSERFYF